MVDKTSFRYHAFEEYDARTRPSVPTVFCETLVHVSSKLSVEGHVSGASLNE